MDILLIEFGRQNLGCIPFCELKSVFTSHSRTVDDPVRVLVFVPIESIDITREIDVFKHLSLLVLLSE